MVTVADLREKSLHNLQRNFWDPWSAVLKLLVWSRQLSEVLLNEK